jgi:hypothetical protein
MLVHRVRFASSAELTGGSDPSDSAVGKLQTPNGQTPMLATGVAGLAEAGGEFANFSGVSDPSHTPGEKRDGGSPANPKTAQSETGATFPIQLRSGDVPVADGIVGTSGDGTSPLRRRAFA